MIFFDVVTPAVIPDWAQVWVFVAVPATTLILSLSGFYFVLLQIVTLRTKVDGKLTQLIDTTKEKAEEEKKLAFEHGVSEGVARAEAIAKAVSDRLLIEEGLKAIGKKELLEAQATAPAISAPISPSEGTTST